MNKRNLLYSSLYLFLCLIGIFSQNLISQIGKPKIKNYLCDINSSSKVKSSRRDVMLFYSTSDGKGLRLAIQSLRSTGSLCRIILFISSTFSITNDFNDFASALHVEVIYNCDEKNDRSFNPHMLRFEYEKQWIIEHLHEIDRVFHSDVFDVFFQGDPFSNHVKKDKLTFIVEPHCVRSCGWNFAWTLACYNESGLNRMRHTYIACSGTIAGSVKDYLKLIHLMINQVEWKRCWNPSYDQPIFNWLLWNGIIKDNGIKYELAGCDSGFFTMQWCVLEKNVLINQHDQVISNLGSVPTYLHQYNRIPGFEDVLFKKCHLI